MTKQADLENLGKLPSGNVTKKLVLKHSVTPKFNISFMSYTSNWLSSGLYYISH